MTITQQEQRILAHVLEMLGTGHAGPGDLEDYLIGYAVLGRLVAIAQGNAEMAEQERKIAWARAFAEAKHGENKVSDKMAENSADLSISELKYTEIQAREKLTNLKNTWLAVEQAINAIKFLGRQGG